MLHKIYGPTIAAPGRYSPAECIGTQKKRIEGNPDAAHVPGDRGRDHGSALVDGGYYRPDRRDAPAPKPRDPYKKRPA